jgi:acetyl-CoA C-acetyltransferase
MKKIYIATYHQSKFGKLLAMTVPEIVRRSVTETCASIGADPAICDLATIGAAAAGPFNRQGLLSGLVADVPGLAAKPIEAVENACATGGQAILAVAQKLQLGLGDVGLALGFEKMRNDEGKMDGERVGEILGYFSHPEDREGKVYVFPHIFAEVMKEYMDTHGVTEEDFAHVSTQEYANAQLNPYAQMNGIQVTLEEASTIGKRNRYIVDGLPLKTYDCSQITDGYAGMILATEEGLTRLGVKKADCVELAGYGQATDPLLKRGREVLRPAGAIAAMHAAYHMAGVDAGDVNVAEIHDCFTVMGGIGAEVIGKAAYGRGLHYWKEGRARPDGECGINTSGGLIAKGHPIGASGVAMVGWAAWQLTGKVPAGLQVSNARVAATFNIGGPICASVCTVLKPA